MKFHKTGRNTLREFLRFGCAFSLMLTGKTNEPEEPIHLSLINMITYVVQSAAKLPYYSLIYP